MKKSGRTVPVERVADLVATPWDELRAARVERRVLDAVRARATTTSRLELAPGCFVLLEPAAHVAVQSASPAELELRHLAGAAAYEVAAGAARPLLVALSRFRLRILEGGFRLETVGSSTLVRVISGRLTIESDDGVRHLSRGEQLTLP